MKNLIFVFIASLFCIPSLFAQNNVQRVLSYTQLFDEIVSCKKDIYVLENANIKFDVNTDRRFYDKDSAYLASIDTLVVSCHVKLDNVNFLKLEDYIDFEHRNNERSPGFQKILFKDTVVITNSNCYLEEFNQCVFEEDLFIVTSVFHTNFNIFHCQFKKGIHLWNVSFEGWYKLYRSVVLGEIHIYEIELAIDFMLLYSDLSNVYCTRSEFDKFTIRQCRINDPLDFYNNRFRILQILDCKIDPIKNIDEGQILKPFVFRKLRLDDFIWSGNTFLSDRNDLTVHFDEIKSKEQFTIEKTNFVANLILASIDCKGKVILGHDSNFDENIHIDQFFFNERSAIAWDNIKGKITQYDYLNLRESPLLADSIESYGLRRSELDNNAYCEALLRTKRIFYNAFKTQGLSINANEAMIEIKELENKIWENDYRNNKSIEAYFRWKMNSFLGKFSAYGTDPVLAMMHSFKIILTFALFYLFFHNDWDYSSIGKVGERLKFMLRYFKLKSGLVELDDDLRKSHSETMKKIKEEYNQSIGHVPSFFTLSTNWYIKSNLFVSSVRKKVLKNMDVLGGTWEELSPRRRRVIALSSSLWFIGYLLFIFIVKVLNAFTLSLNAFTTIGFGKIPTHGFSRYIVIIEGFLGWLMMTIFSVTLIRQLLQ